MSGINSESKFDPRSFSRRTIPSYINLPKFLDQDQLVQVAVLHYDHGMTWETAIRAVSLRNFLPTKNHSQ